MIVSHVSRLVPIFCVYAHVSLSARGPAYKKPTHSSVTERENLITRQPPIREKDDYDSENFNISDGLPSSSRRRRRGEGRREGEEWREK